MSELNEKWKIEDAVRLYGIHRWGSGYFGVNPDGHVTVHPEGETGPAIDLIKAATRARERGLHYPLLIRFHDLLRHRVRAINEAFAEAIKSARYKGEYRGVFPIKVNQMREVVEEILDAGEPYHYGLEVGSKPELFAALAHHRDPESLLVCNGYKDGEFIRTALLGRKLGKKVILVVEKLEELRTAVETARAMQVQPLLGIRVRLSARGSANGPFPAGRAPNLASPRGSSSRPLSICKRRVLPRACRCCTSMSVPRFPTSWPCAAPSARRPGITANYTRWG